MEKVKIKYVGIYQIYLTTPGFSDIVNPGQEIEVLSDVYNSEFKGHADWEPSVIGKCAEKKGKE